MNVYVLETATRLQASLWSQQTCTLGVAFGEKEVWVLEYIDIYIVFINSVKKFEAIKIKTVLRAQSNMKSNFKFGVKSNERRIKSISSYK